MTVIENFHTSEFRWIARIIASLASIFFLLFTIGLSLTGCTEKGITKESIIFLPMLGIAIIGAIIAWFSVKIGGILLIIAGSSMGIYLMFIRGIAGVKVAMIFGLPFLISGLIFLMLSKSKIEKSCGASPIH